MNSKWKIDDFFSIKKKNRKKNRTEIFPYSTALDSEIGWKIVIQQHGRIYLLKNKQRKKTQVFRNCFGIFFNLMKRIHIFQRDQSIKYRLLSSAGGFSCVGVSNRSRKKNNLTMQEYLQDNFSRHLHNSLPRFFLSRSFASQLI